MLYVSSSKQFLGRERLCVDEGGRSLVLWNLLVFSLAGLFSFFDLCTAETAELHLRYTRIVSEVLQ